ncbi:MAG: hypothetical protein H6607_12345 [Flavobacteriales bacterium]|nr:hypothetical protein [Flavobacteriales bacterium]
MTDLEQKLWKFEITLKEVVSRIDGLKSENEALRQKNEELSLDVERQKNIIKDIEENNKKVKIAEAIILPESEKSELKEQIDGYLKEIDRCIALLNS